VDFSSKFFIISAIFLLAVLVNLPFGFMRSRVKKFSLKWMIYVHLPVPLVILARLFSQIEFHYIPLFIVGGIIGQLCGGKIKA
jgi:hypothetical protein